MEEEKMRYKYSDDENEELRDPFISDNTAFARMQTELETDKKGLVNSDMIKRHRPRVLSLNKFAPLSNIANKGQIQLDRIRRCKIDLLEEAGLHDDAIETALDNIADLQLSRGIGGFYQRAMITQRHEFKEDMREERKKRFGSFFKKAQPEAEEE